MLKDRAHAFMQFKLLLRRLLLCAAFPPFLPLFRTIYHITIRFATLTLRRYPGVRVVYLTGSCAKGEAIYGSSDIDLRVIVAGDMNTSARENLERDYRFIAKATGLLDHKNRVTVDETVVQRYFSHNYGYQFRYTQGKTDWKLLAGTDWLQSLPSLDQKQWEGGWYNALNGWWSVFGGQIFETTRYHKDSISCNTLCYKLVAEVLKIRHYFETGATITLRAKVLETSKGLLNPQERQLVEKLQKIAKRRFLPQDFTLRDETLHFLFCFLNDFHKGLAFRPFTQAIRPLYHVIECPPQEDFPNERERKHVKDLTVYLQKEWGDTLRGVSLSPGIFWWMDELFCLISVEGERLPTALQLSTLIGLHQSTSPLLSRRIRLALLLPNVGVQLTDLTSSTHRDRHLLTPAFSPDTFELLTRPEFTLWGKPVQQAQLPTWTDTSEHYLIHWKQQWHWRECHALYDKPLPTLSNLDFLRRFWKSLQLTALASSVARGEATYSMTVPALERALEREGMPLPKSLKPLSEAYSLELQGEVCDIQALIPTALAYLHDMEP